MRAARCWLSLVGWWWGNRVECPEYCALHRNCPHHPPGWWPWIPSTNYCYVYSIRKETGPCPRLHYCFWTANPTSFPTWTLVFPPASLIIAVCICPWNSGRKSQGGEWSLFLQKEARTGMGFCAWRAPTGSCLVSLTWFLFFLLNFFVLLKTFSS